MPLDIKYILLPLMGVMLSDAISRADVLLTAVRAEKGQKPYHRLMKPWYKV